MHNAVKERMVATGSLTPEWYNGLKLMSSAQRAQFFPDVDPYLQDLLVRETWANASVLNCQAEESEKLRLVGLQGCSDDRWYYPDACRGTTGTVNSSKNCIPVVLSSVGWLGTETARVLNSTGVPAKLTFTKNWTTYVQLGQNFNTGKLSNKTANPSDKTANPAFFFWWRPDHTFQKLEEPPSNGVARLYFPPHDTGKWYRTDPPVLDTDFPGFQLRKLLWAGVGDANPHIVRLFDRFVLSEAQIGDIMNTIVAAGGNTSSEFFFETACEFLKQNPQIWKMQICPHGEQVVVSTTTNFGTGMAYIVSDRFQTGVRPVS